MKKLFVFTAFIFISFLSDNLIAQVYQNSWGIGFGPSYPRFYSSDVGPMQGNYGGVLSIKRNFSENVAMRLSGNYSYMEANIPAGYYYKNNTKVQSGVETMDTRLISVNLDLLYYLAPCSPVDPYLGAGVGAAYFTPDWPGSVINPFVKSKTTAQMNLVFGSEWKMTDDWKLINEFGFHSIDGEVDGIYNNNRQGILASNTDGYITVNMGVMYYFFRGPKSKCCDLYQGVANGSYKENNPTLAQIDSLIKAHIPKEVEKQVLVPESKNWVLYGVNFSTNESDLLPESYPALEHAKQILKDNPEIKVEIRGYTDNVGTDESNQKLSERRAVTVRDYLIKGGIEANRLTAVGFGKSNPIGDNNTDIGKAKNRRIEFKIISPK